MDGALSRKTMQNWNHSDENKRVGTLRGFNRRKFRKWKWNSLPSDVNGKYGAKGKVENVHRKDIPRSLVHWLLIDAEKPKAEEFGRLTRHRQCENRMGDGEWEAREIYQGTNIYLSLRRYALFEQTWPMKMACKSGQREEEFGKIGTSSPVHASNERRKKKWGGN